MLATLVVNNVSQLQQDIKVNMTTVWLQVITFTKKNDFNPLIKVVWISGKHTS
jgi:hypothetical protein